MSKWISSPVSITSRPSSPDFLFFGEEQDDSTDELNRYDYSKKSTGFTSKTMNSEFPLSLRGNSSTSKFPSITSITSTRPNSPAFRDTISRQTSRPSSSACKRDSISRVAIYESSHLGPGCYFRYGVFDNYRPKSPVLYKETVTSHQIKRDDIPPPGTYNVKCNLSYVFLNF